MSAAEEYGNLVFDSGTLPDNPDAGIREQTANILSKIDAVLAAAGTNKSKVLSASIWVTDIRNREAMNEAWLAWIDRESAARRLERRSPTRAGSSRSRSPRRSSGWRLLVV
jgi:enamine deaminase RidA (YjgF/YER057c/UK114 family)